MSNYLNGYEVMTSVLSVMTRKCYSFCKPTQTGKDDTNGN